jgi:hypothetical protein
MSVGPSVRGHLSRSEGRCRLAYQIALPAYRSIVNRTRGGLSTSVGCRARTMEFIRLVALESGNPEFAASLLGPSERTLFWRARFKEVRPARLAWRPTWTPPHTRAPGCGGPDYREGLGSDRRGRSRPLKPRRRRHPCGGADGAGGGRTGDIPLGKQTLCQLSYSRSGDHTGYQPCAAKTTTGAAVVAIIVEGRAASRAPGRRLADRNVTANRYA